MCTAWLNGGLGVRIALVVGTITGLPLIGVHGLRAPRVGLYSVHVPVSRSWRIVASGHGQGVQGRSPCPLTQGSVHGRLIVVYINAANWVFATHCVWFPTPTTPPSQSHICLGYGICMSMCPGVSFSLVTHLMHRFLHRSHDPLWLSNPLYPPDRCKLGQLRFGRYTGRVHLRVLPSETNTHGASDLNSWMNVGSALRGIR